MAGDEPFVDFSLSYDPNVLYGAHESASEAPDGDKDGSLAPTEFFKEDSRYNEIASTCAPSYSSLSSNIDKVFNRFTQTAPVSIRVAKLHPNHFRLYTTGNIYANYINANLNTLGFQCPILDGWINVGTEWVFRDSYFPRLSLSCNRVLRQGIFVDGLVDAKLEYGLHYCAASACYRHKILNTQLTMKNHRGSNLLNLCMSTYMLGLVCGVSATRAFDKQDQLDFKIGYRDNVNEAHIELVNFQDVTLRFGHALNSIISLGSKLSFTRSEWVEGSLSACVRVADGVMISPMVTTAGTVGIYYENSFFQNLKLSFMAVAETSYFRRITGSKFGIGIDCSF